MSKLIILLLCLTMSKTLHLLLCLYCGIQMVQVIQDPDYDTQFPAI